MSFLRLTPVIAGGGTSYTTSFPLTENPISESNAWYKNPSNAWQNIETTGGNAIAAAYSHETGHTDDAYAYLKNFPSDNYEIITTMFKGGINQGEVEILGRVTDNASQIFAYEVLINTAGGWQLVRWNGNLDSYDVIYPPVGGALQTGFGGDDSQHKAVFNGTLFSFYQRQVSTDSWTTRLVDFDLTSAGSYYTTGKPGMAIYVVSANSAITYTGWKDYTVTAL